MHYVTHTHLLERLTRTRRNSSSEYLLAANSAITTTTTATADTMRRFHLIGNSISCSQLRRHHPIIHLGLNTTKTTTISSSVRRRPKEATTRKMPHQWLTSCFTSGVCVGQRLAGIDQAEIPLDRKKERKKPILLSLATQSF